MQRILSMAIAAGLLAACTEQAQTDVARQTAKAILSPIVQKQFPGKNSEMITNCAINNASTQEIISLGAGAATQNASETSSVAGRLLSKPATIECITKGLLGGV